MSSVQKVMELRDENKILFKKWSNGPEIIENENRLTGVVFRIRRTKDENGL